jgi:hypothetical protein
MQPTYASSVHAPAPPIQTTSDEIKAKSSIPQVTRKSVQTTPHLQKTPQLQKETPQSVKAGGSNHRVLMSCSRKCQQQHNLRMMLLDVYLYIIVFPLVRRFPAYLHTCTCTITTTDPRIGDD